jgi:tungstate transport system substrate-binding protein
MPGGNARAAWAQRDSTDMKTFWESAPGRRFLRPFLFASCALAAAVVLACGPPPSEMTLEIATTTSVQNSGLLDALVPAYLEATGVTVRVHAAGSGRALQMLEEGLASLVISHAPETERRMLARHPEWIRRPLAYNWFVVVGPPDDPASVRGAPDAVEAFRRIAVSPSPFVSRGDLSGTHERENALWDVAGVRPPAGRLIVSGRGMAQALRHADEARAYTLSDDATFRQLSGGLDLIVVHEGDERLRNVYSVIYPDDAARDDACAAAAFARWLVEGEGRRLMNGFTIQGAPALHLLPAEPFRAEPPRP